MHNLEVFGSADEVVRSGVPEMPVCALRPHASKRAARWFLDHFPGDVVYALKANGTPQIVSSLLDAGISQFDVASLSEIRKAKKLGVLNMHYMNPVKSRRSIGAAYFDYGVRSFAVDSEVEFEKIHQETNRASDLTIFLRLASDGHLSRIPLGLKYGVSGDIAVSLLKSIRSRTSQVGVTFHIGSQAINPDAFTSAMLEAEEIILKAGVLVDVLDVGGGFPSIYPDCTPPPLELFLSCILRQFDEMTLGEHCRLMCEPGRALVAEAESVIVQVDARRNRELYISDGAFGMLYDAAHSGFTFPARRLGDDPARAPQLAPFSLWGPTCDSIDFLKGPFLLPVNIKEGDYVEIGQLGAYGRTLSSAFCGFGEYMDVILEDEPILSMYADPTEVDALSATVQG